MPKKTRKKKHDRRKFYETLAWNNLYTRYRLMFLSSSYSADLLVLKNEALNAKNAENAKAKLAAIAARDLATANDKLYLKSPTAVSKEQATYAAFERANDAALEASKNRQLGLYSKTDPEHDTSTAPVVDKYVFSNLIYLWSVAAPEDLILTISTSYELPVWNLWVRRT